MGQQERGRSWWPGSDATAQHSGPGAAHLGSPARPRRTAQDGASAWLRRGDRRRPEGPQAWFGLAWPGTTRPGSLGARTLLAAAGDTDRSSLGARPPSRLTQRRTSSLKALPSPGGNLLKRTGQASRRPPGGKSPAPLAPGREERGPSALRGGPCGPAEVRGAG